MAKMRHDACLTEQAGNAAMASSSTLQWAVVLVGLMGSGKSAVGRTLADILDVPFADGDALIEARAECTIPDIFRNRGERAFRELEEKSLHDSLLGPPLVLASGGGAFMNEVIRACIRQRAVSVWLRAKLDTLVERCGSGAGRPLLADNPRDALQSLMESRYPVYAEADLTVDTDGVPVKRVARDIEEALRQRGTLR